jgi:hypothetical protein
MMPLQLRMSSSALTMTAAPPVVSVKALNRVRRTKLDRSCPLWVRSEHGAIKLQCPVHP